MTNFAADWESRLPSLRETALVMPGSLERNIPGLTSERLVNLFQRVEVGLARLDKSGPKHPEQLVYGSSSAPAYLISQVDNFIAWMSQNATVFAQNGLPSLIECLNRIERAVGLRKEELRELESAAAADLSASMQQAIKRLEEIEDSSQRSRDLNEEVSKLVETMKSTSFEAGQHLGQIRTVVSRVKAVAGTDSKSKDNLEQLVKLAHKKLEDLSKIRQSAFDS